MAIGSSDSCDRCLRNESDLNECPLVPESGCNVINNNNNSIYLLQLGITRWQWLFYMFTNMKESN